MDSLIRPFEADNFQNKFTFRKTCQNIYTFWENFQNIFIISKTCQNIYTFWDNFQNIYIFSKTCQNIYTFWKTCQNIYTFWKTCQKKGKLRGTFQIELSVGKSSEKKIKSNYPLLAAIVRAQTAANCLTRHVLPNLILVLSSALQFSIF